MSSSSDQYDEETTKLEPIVVLALSRLQKGNRYSNPNKRSSGVTFEEVVMYVTDNFCHLDGDIESQVMTALLSCVRNGIICALSNGKYRLIGPSSKSIVSSCLTRSSHGSGCSCLDFLSNISTKACKICCNLKTGRPFRKIKKRQQARKPPKLANKPKTTKKKTKKKSCLLRVDPSLDDRKCKYCLEYHPPPEEKPKQASKKKTSSKTFPPGTRHGVPLDKFSPREEGS